MRRLFGVIVLTCMVGLAVTGCTQSSVGPSTNSSPSQGAASQGATPAPSTAATSQSTNGSASASQTEEAQPTAAATLAKFNKVKDGMTYAEVLKIMGGPGKKIGESASGDIHVAMYGWYGADPMNVAVVSFLNGAVNAKQQQGLK